MVTTMTGSTPAKKQQSISNFFTPKTANGVSASGNKESRPQSKTSQAPPVAQEWSIESANIYDAESDKEESPVEVLLTKRPLVEKSYEESDEEEDSVRLVIDRRSPKRPLVEDPDAVNNGGERGGKRVKGNNDNTAPKKPKISPRTERYIYDSAAQNGTHLAPISEVPIDDDAATRSQKEELHRRFVKKLGHPDSITQIKRRNYQITEETAQLDDEDAEGDEEEDDTPPPAPTAKGKRKGAKTGKLTPMEMQMLEIKRKHLDAILIVEVGYKFKFFGEDARIAAKELGIVCIPGRLRYDEHPSEAHLDRFATASIPVHRLPVHAKRLVVAGHKVGVVRQIETAALKKAGDNRNTPFIRKLTNLYTKGTYIDDIEGLDQPTNAPSGGAPASGYLLCITESKSKGWGTDEKVDVGVLAVQPATGDVIYDNFEDGFMRSEIETRLLHISPCEFLIVGDLTKASDKLLQHLSGSTNVFGDKIRVERVDKPKTMAAESYSHVTQFYAGKMKARGNPDDERAANLLDKVLKLPEPVTICLSAMITHMTEYGLEHVFDLTKYFQSFSARSHMLLNGNTLTSLEIFHNQTDHSEKGSLFWALDRTQTRFGQRLLRKWVGRPLLDRHQLEQRVSAVEELKEENHTVNVEKLRSLLVKIKSDLERSLIRIYYGKCTRPELLTVLQTMQRIANEFAHVRTPADAGFKSSLINEAIAALPVIGPTVIGFLDKINPEAARTDDKYAFFRETDESEAITDHKLGIASVEQELDAHRAIAASKLHKKSIHYTTVSGIEYLVEVPNPDLKHVPASWAKISGTKKLSRFHTPDVVRMLRERDQHKESLAAACDAAFKALLDALAADYQAFRDAVANLATLDCLLALATVAAQPGYVKPVHTDEPEIQIEGGRHPMVEQLLRDDYIPNDTSLAGITGTTTDVDKEATRALLITGPNMGGKSSYVRHVALIAILSQIGSYVPATSARLGLLDAIFTRMGALDNLMKGESTFMVELSETSDLLKQATPRSLVILDELGRGTSTHDGVAIARAVLEYVVREVRCLTLFITHYQSLAGVADGWGGGGGLKNVHMGFVEEEDGGGGNEGHPKITFLYQVVPGVAHRSYGLNVARLADVPEAVLEVAGMKSREMEEGVKGRRLKALGRLMRGVCGGGEGGGELIGGNEGRTKKEMLEWLVAGIEEL